MQTRTQALKLRVSQTKTMMMKTKTPRLAATRRRRLLKKKMAAMALKVKTRVKTAEARDAATAMSQMTTSLRNPRKTAPITKKKRPRSSSKKKLISMRSRNVKGCLHQGHGQRSRRLISTRRSRLEMNLITQASSSS